MPGAQIIEVGNSIDNIVRREFNEIIHSRHVSARDFCYKAEGLKKYNIDDQSELFYFENGSPKSDYIDINKREGKTEVSMNRNSNGKSLFCLCKEYKINGLDVSVAYSEIERNENYSRYDMFVRIKDKNKTHDIALGKYIKNRESNGYLSARFVEDLNKHLSKNNNVKASDICRIYASNIL
jgi:uncharacterized membrane protein YfhO